MDEITLVTAVAPAAPPRLPAAVREAARATLLAEIAAEREAGPIPGRATAPGPRRRMAAPKSRHLVRWGIAGAALSAAAAAGAAMILTVQPPSALAAVTSAAARTAAQSYQVTVAFSAFAPAGHARVQWFTGRFSRSAAIGEDYGQRFRITGGYLYQQGGPSWHGRWFRTPAPPLTSAEARQAALAGDPEPGGVASPAVLLALLKSASHVWQQGRASGPGWTGTRYAFTATQQLNPEVTVKFTGTVGVDQRGRVRQFDETQTQTLRPPAKGPSPLVQTVKATFSDFGVPVRVTAPPPSRVILPLRCLPGVPNRICKQHR